MGEALNDETLRLLGGYATNTLTPEEREQLFAAALRDGELFEALHDEEALRQLLEQPAARAQLLEAANSPEFTLAGSLREWWERPRGKVLASLLTVSLLMVSVRLWQDRVPVRVGPAQSAAHRESLSSPGPGEAPRSTAVSPVEPRQTERRAGVARNPATAAPIAPAPQTDIAEQSEQGAVAATSQPGAPQGEIRWIVQRRAADGTFSAVSHDTRFETTDVVRVQAASSRPGRLVVTTGERLVYTGPVQVGQVVTLPRTFSFADTAELKLSASVMPDAAMRVSTQFRSSDAAPPAAAAEPIITRAPSPAESSEIVLRRK